MTDGDVQSLTTTDSDESNRGAMDARSDDYSEDELTFNRRKSITRGRGANKIRERSLTPTGEDRRLSEQEVTSSPGEVRSVNEQEVPTAPKEEKTEEGNVQLKIQPRKVPSIKEEIT